MLISMPYDDAIQPSLFVLADGNRNKHTCFTAGMPKRASEQTFSAFMREFNNKARLKCTHCELVILYLRVR